MMGRDVTCMLLRISSVSLQGMKLVVMIVMMKMMIIVMTVIVMIIIMLQGLMRAIISLLSVCQLSFTIK